MKKINIVCALSAAALLIMGCEKNEYDDGPGNPGQVSEAAKTAFETKYPGAQNVRWTVKGEHAVANFSLSTTDAESASEGQSDAWFRNGNGVWDMTATNLRIIDLPEAVQEGFRASKYGDETLWTPTGKCDRLERRDVMLPTADGKSIVVYVIGVESASAKGVKTTLDVYFSEDGILVNEVAGAPDNGYEDQLPQQPQGSVEQYLQTNIVDKGGRDGDRCGERRYGGRSASRQPQTGTLFRRRPELGLHQDGLLPSGPDERRDSREYRRGVEDVGALHERSECG